MANRRYDDPRTYEGRGRSGEEERLRRGPREDMRPGSREEWDQNQEDYARAQEAVRTRGYREAHELREAARTGRSGREYALDEGAFYDELREEQEFHRRHDPSHPSSRLYDTDTSLPLGPGRPEEEREDLRYRRMRKRTGAERGGYGPGPRGPREFGTRDVYEQLRREELRRDQRGPHIYNRRYGGVYGHGPGVENMDPPLTGYRTSRTRADDHEMGHGGFLGGRYRRTEGRPPPPPRPTGRPPKGYTRSDARIREDICERLMDAWMDVEHVEVRVKDSEVTLVGAVRSRDEKHAIENLAASVLGVKDVHNSLLVERGAIRVDPDMRRPVEPTDDTLHS